MPDSGMVLVYGGLFLLFVAALLIFVPGEW